MFAFYIIRWTIITSFHKCSLTIINSTCHPFRIIASIFISKVLMETIYNQSQLSYRPNQKLFSEMLSNHCYSYNSHSFLLFIYKNPHMKHCI